MFEDGSDALWLALNPKNYSGPTEISRFQLGRLVNVIGSKHPLPGGVILKEVRGIARDQEGGIWLFDLNQGLFRLADGMVTRIANALEPSLTIGFCTQIERAGSGSANAAKWHSTVTESLKYLGRATVLHRGGFGRS
jgi:hypothetical protein